MMNGKFLFFFLFRFLFIIFYFVGSFFELGGNIFELNRARNGNNNQGCGGGAFYRLSGSLTYDSSVKFNNNLALGKCKGPNIRCSGFQGTSSPANYNPPSGYECSNLFSSGSGNFLGVSDGPH